MRRDITCRRMQGMAAVLVLLLAVRPMAAHSLGAECKVQGDRIKVEAYFDDDTAAADAYILVCNVAQKVVAEGRTDAKGVWSFAVPETGLYRITVDAGAGHRTTIRIKVPARTTEADLTATAASGGCECCTTDGKAAVPMGAVISEGPSRAEFTRLPWGKVTLGLTAIALMGLAWGGCRRWQSRRRSGDRAKQELL
jgi:nickel transport protein